jgi:hypothetical protein
MRESMASANGRHMLASKEPGKAVPAVKDVFWPPIKLNEVERVHAGENYRIVLASSAPSKGHIKGDGASSLKSQQPRSKYDKNAAGRDR